MGIEGFLNRYFIAPVFTGEGYNIYNTLVYGVLLIVGAYGVTKLVRRFGVVMDRELFYAALPFVALGGILRALEEFARLTGTGFLPTSPMFLTPGIYILIAFISILSLCISSALRGEKYRPMMSGIGLVMVLLASLLVLGDVWVVASGSAAGFFLRPSLLFWITLIASAFTFFGMRILKHFGMGSRENTLILCGFAFEATAVTAAVYSLSYSVEQPFTQALLSINPLLYPFFKVGLIVGLLYLVEGVPKNDDAYWMSKLLFLVLGFPMGLHNTLQIFLGL